MKKLLSAIITFVILIPSFAIACSKPVKVDENGELILEQPTDKLKNTKYIFRGLAYKTELIEHNDSEFKEQENLHYIKVYFKPIEIFKGDVSEESYAISYNGYIGGCAAPVLVGVEYLVALPEIKPDSSFPITSRSLFENSLGVLDIFNTEALPYYKPKLEEIMTPVREWAKANPK